MKMEHTLAAQIAALEALVPDRTGGGARRRLTPAERVLRAARLAQTAEGLEGASWARGGEEPTTSGCRGALWRQAVLISAIELVHRELEGKSFPGAIPAAWMALDRPGQHVPPPTMRDGEAVRAAWTELGEVAGKANMLGPWLAGNLPEGLWATLKLGVGVRHAVAHGTLTPTLARRWRVEPLLRPLFTANLGWLVGVLGVAVIRYSEAGRTAGAAMSPMPAGSPRGEA